MERIDKIKSFLATSPADSFLQHALALEYIKMENDNEARTMFEAILQKEPGYVGSYYHLGKLLERAGDYENAVNIYTKGMEQAKVVKDNHSLNELQGALDEITE